MKLSKIIKAMVKGLKDPKNIKVDMGSFGHIEDGVCFGCAATLTLQEIYSADLSRCEKIESGSERAVFLGTSLGFVWRIESLINTLRLGTESVRLLLLTIPDSAYILDKPKETSIELSAWTESNHLPKLETEGYLDNLGPYEELSVHLEEKGL